MLPLKSLLEQSITRNHIAKEVTTAHMLETVNDELQRLLPAQGQQDAKAVSLREGVVMISCRHGSAAHVVSTAEADILSRVKRRFPKSPITRLQTRVDGG